MLEPTSNRPHQNGNGQTIDSRYDQLRSELLNKTRMLASKTDSAHDFLHLKRVLKLGEYLQAQEGGDRNVILAACLLHDIVIHPKDHPESSNDHKYSADKARTILSDSSLFPTNKIAHVEECILHCSFGNRNVPNSIEEAIVRDADMLEAAGALAIMRTFSSCGQMERAFYNEEDPLASARTPNAKMNGLDLFHERLLKIPERVHTKSAQNLAIRRTDFTRAFLAQVGLELRLCD